LGEKVSYVCKFGWTDLNDRYAFDEFPRKDLPFDNAAHLVGKIPPKHIWDISNHFEAKRAKY